jgi:translation initiation factor IF-2
MSVEIEIVRKKKKQDEKIFFDGEYIGDEGKIFIKDLESFFPSEIYKEFIEKKMIPEDKVLKKQDVIAIEKWLLDKFNEAKEPIVKEEKKVEVIQEVNTPKKTKQKVNSFTELQKELKTEPKNKQSIAVNNIRNIGYGFESKVAKKEINYDKGKKLFNKEKIENYRTEINRNIEESNNIRLKKEKVHYEKRKVQKQTVEKIEKKTPNQIYAQILNYDKVDKKVPVVSIMGHVNHGKTTLVDHLLNMHTKEVGNITQGISINKLKSKDGDILLIDTPGHEIFSGTRSLIAKLSDIIVILISAIDGVQQQTVEIIKLVQELDKPIILCITNIDQGKHKINNIYNELYKYNIISDQVNGDVLTTLVSVVSKEGIENLLELINLQATSMDLKTKIDHEAIGTIIDVVLKKGFGYESTVLLEAGTIKQGDSFIYADKIGKARYVWGDNKQKKEVSVNYVTKVIGFDGIPSIGEKFLVVNDEAIKEVALLNKEKDDKAAVNSDRKYIAKSESGIKLDSLVKELSKTGKVISQSIGDVTDNDIEIAKTYGALITIFDKVNDKKVAPLSHYGIHVLHSEIIYELMEKVEEFFKVEEKKELVEIGSAEIKRLFHIKKDVIAGCKVLSGIIKLGKFCKIFDKDVEIGGSKVISMKREQESIDESRKDTECGLIFGKKLDLKEGLKIICYE